MVRSIHWASTLEEIADIRHVCLDISVLVAVVSPVE